MYRPKEYLNYLSTGCNSYFDLKKIPSYYMFFLCIYVKFIYTTLLVTAPIIINNVVLSCLTEILLTPLHRNRHFYVT